MKKICIIGAGMGGLVAGNLLARKGHQVTVFESHREPGGYTAGFRKKGWYFESGTLAFESSDAVFKAMKDLGVYEKISFVRKRARFFSADFDGSPESFEAFQRLCLDAYPTEREKLERYFAEVDKMVRVLRAMAKPGKLLSLLAYPFSLLRMISLMRRYGDVSITDFTERFFGKGTRLFRLFKNFGYPDMAAWILGGAIFTIFEDYWTVKDGMQSWANVLAENLKKLGGELKLNAPVERILTKAGAAVGVSSKGTRYEADFVISASDYKKTFLELLDDPALIPGELKERIEETAVSEGFFTVYLGLGLSNDELKRHMKQPYVLVLDEEPGTDIRNPEDERYFDKAGVTLFSPSLMNPKGAPESKSSLMIQAVAPYRWMNNWGGGDREQYKRLKENAQDALVRRAEVVIPALGGHIEFEDSATPLTYERYTGNTDGATSAWSWNPSRRFYRNMWGTNTRTPVRNLLIGSCWATQIGGVPGALAAAYRCAKAIR